MKIVFINGLNKNEVIKEVESNELDGDNMSYLNITPLSIIVLNGKVYRIIAIKPDFSSMTADELDEIKRIEVILL